MGAGRLGAIRQALSHANYRIYTTGNLVSLVGTWMQRVAVGWVTWELTGSGFWLGVVAFADLFPSVVLSPITGAVADRRNRLAVARTSQALGMVQALALCVLAFADALTIERLLALVVFLGVVVAFNQPARLSLVPNLVPREDLAAAIAINSIIFNLARFIGPAVAGFVIVTGGVAWTFAVNAASFLAFLVALARLRLPPDDSAGRKHRRFVEEIVEGYRYSLGHPGIRLMLMLLLASSICLRAVIELLPGFAAEVFGRGAEGLAALTAATGIGASIGGLWLARRGTLGGLTAVTVHSLMALAICMLAYAATADFGIGLATIGAAGCLMVGNGVGAQTLIQAAVEASLRGRVLSLFGMILRGGPAIGALVMGAASTVYGLRAPVAVGAVLALLFWLWAVGRLRAVAPALEGERTAPPPKP